MSDSVFDLERMVNEMNYRVTFFYSDTHKTIVNLNEQDVKDLSEAFSNDVSTFIIEDFGRYESTLFINIKAVRFTVVQESEGSERSLSELSRVSESSNN